MSVARSDDTLVSKPKGLSGACFWVLGFLNVDAVLFAQQLGKPKLTGKGGPCDLRWQDRVRAPDLLYPVACFLSLI